MPKRARGMYLFGGVVPIEPEMLQSSGAFSPEHNCVKIAPRRLYRRLLPACGSIPVPMQNFPCRGRRSFVWCSRMVIEARHGLPLGHVK